MWLDAHALCEQVLSWVHDRLDEVKDEPAPSPLGPHEGTQQQPAQAPEGQGRGWVALVLIDHMNRPKDYTALLQDWARELQLQGERVRESAQKSRPHRSDATHSLTNSPAAWLCVDVCM